MHVSPFRHLPSNLSVRATATKTVPTLRLRPRTRTVRFATVTELLIWPPYGRSRFQRTLPVSALTANTQPREEPTYMQPSETTGVPTMSPAPPELLVEKVHAGVRKGAS